MAPIVSDVLCGDVRLICVAPIVIDALCADVRFNP